MYKQIHGQSWQIEFVTCQTESLKSVGLLLPLKPIIKVTGPNKIFTGPNDFLSVMTSGPVLFAMTAWGNAYAYVGCPDSVHQN